MSLLRLCILTLRSDAGRVAHLFRSRGYSVVCARALRTAKKIGATGSRRAPVIPFFWVTRCQFLELLVDVQVPLLMPMRYRGARWGRQGGDTCPHQFANTKHVSSPPSAPPGEKKKERFAAFLGEALAVPPHPFPNPKSIIPHPNIQ